MNKGGNQYINISFVYILDIMGILCNAKQIKNTAKTVRKPLGTLPYYKFEREIE